MDLMRTLCNFGLGNGFHIPCCEAIWLEENSFFEEFPVIYALSHLKKVTVASMGGWCDRIWRWGDLGINNLLLAPLDRVAISSLFAKLKGIVLEENK